MEQVSLPEEASEVLLEQFELLLDHHLLIDEVGFIHPSQFAELKEDSSVSWSLPSKIWQTLHESRGSEKCLQTEKTIFWYGNHKLAISMQIVPVLYNAAQIAHMDARISYKRFINLTQSKNCVSTAVYEAQLPKIDILKHSKALLILSPDIGSVWNSRKLVLTREPDLSLLIDELHLSMLVLSYSPKTEQAWSHRRWVIKKIAEVFDDVCDFIEKELKFVKTIAKKSKMNFRAWNYCCWLMLHMNKGQRLIFNLLEDNFLKADKEKLSFDQPCFFDLLKKELMWNMHLIKQYKGREALWVHRRFLSYHLIKLISSPAAIGVPFRVQKDVISALDCFYGEEIELMHACLNFSAADEFGDVRAQAQHAAAYILWISKVFDLFLYAFPISLIFYFIHLFQFRSFSAQKGVVHLEYRFQDKLKEVGNLKTLLMNISPEKSLLWEGLLNQLPVEFE